MWRVRLSSAPGDTVSADRGFDTDEMVGLMHAEVRSPLFTKGYSQVHAQDVESIRELAGLYIFMWRVWLGLCVPSWIHNFNRNPADLFGASLWRWRDHIPGPNGDCMLRTDKHVPHSQCCVKTCILWAWVLCTERVQTLWLYAEQYVSSHVPGCMMMELWL